MKEKVIGSTHCIRNKGKSKKRRTRRTKPNKIFTQNRKSPISKKKTKQKFLCEQCNYTKKERRGVLPRKTAKRTRTFFYVVIICVARSPV